MSDTPTTATDHPAPTRSLARWMQGSWWATGLFGIATSVTALTARDAASTWVESGVRADAVDWDDLEVGASGAMSLLAMATFVALVVTIVWLWQTHRHQATRRPDRSRWGAGWTAVSWVIPVLNFIVPKILFQDAERVALDATSDDRRRLSLVGHLYWLGWVVGSVSVGLATIIWDGSIPLTDLDSLDRSAVLDAYTWRIVGGIGLGVAGVAGALHLRHLHQLVTAAASAAPPADLPVESD